MWLLVAMMSNTSHPSSEVQEVLLLDRKRSHSLLRQLQIHISHCHSAPIFKVPLNAILVNPEVDSITTSPAGVLEKSI